MGTRVRCHDSRLTRLRQSIQIRLLPAHSRQGVALVDDSFQ
jgi:hypothetical protein